MGQTRTRLDALSGVDRRYALRCPSGCAVPVVVGAPEAARLVREHPDACPDPGYPYRPGLPTGADQSPGARRVAGWAPRTFEDHEIQLHPYVWAEPVR